MTSLLRTLQLEWNSLVPAAQARGIRRVRLLRTDASGVPVPLETIAYRQAKVNWLKSQLLVSTDFNSLTFGVEIECILPYGVSRERIAAAIREAGIDCFSEVYNHVNRGTWKVITDASLGYEQGAEIVSPPLRGEAGFEALRKVCQVLTQAGAKVNKKCGFHVHVGAQNQHVPFFKNLVKLYAAAQGAIDSFLSPSRRGNNNRFCLPIDYRPGDLNAAQTVNQVAAAMGQSSISPRNDNRYRKLNLQSFWQHGTVEFRHHQGTVEAVKAENWVRLCLRMCLLAAQEEKVPSTVQELLEDVKATEAERNYFLGRVTYFQQRPAR